MSGRTVEGDRDAIVSWLAARAGWTPIAELAEFMRGRGYRRKQGVGELRALIRTGRIERRRARGGTEYRAGGGP